MLRYILISLILFLTASTASAASKGAYSIYRIDATTSKATLLAQGTESKRTRVMALCMAQVKQEKSSGIRCVWDNKMIFSKKAPRVRTPKKTSSATSTTVVTPTVSNEPKSNFDGYIDGRIIVVEASITRAGATELCGKMMRANPQSEITCRWGGEVLDTRAVAAVVEAGKIEVIASSLDTGTGKYLMRNKEQSIGTFALKSGSGLGLQKLETLTLRQNGSAPLASLVYNVTDARLIDIETGKSILATAKISNTNIVFSDIALTLSGNTTRHFRILLNIIDIPMTADATTIGLSLTPDDIIIRDASTSTRTSVSGNPYTLRSYIIGTVPPTLTLSNVGENLFRMKVTNPDENHVVTIRSIGASTSFTLPSGRTFAGTLCAREKGTSTPCGANGATTLASPSSGNSISLSNASMPNVILIGGSLEIDFYISSNDIYPTGATTSMTIDSMTYTMDQKTLTSQYGGLPTSRSTYSK